MTTPAAATGGTGEVDGVAAPAGYGPVAHAIGNTIVCWVQADPDWEPAWQAELDRRAAASDATGTPPAEWSEVRARVLGKLASR